MKGKGVCYYCKQTSHFKHECPALKKNEDSSGTTKTKGRIYSLDGEKTKSKNALITDVCYLGLHSSPLIPPMTVAVATGGRVTSK
ncbi:hypothetical protein A2U01_0056924, partial [Trifolium medium]|nr:hypothetical protein [Trifolium medium]